MNEKNTKLSIAPYITYGGIITYRQWLSVTSEMNGWLVGYKQTMIVSSLTSVDTNQNQ